jgi:leucine dehydrogenase
VGLVGVFDRLASGSYEQVTYCHDERTGLRAIIAIHSTVLGPSLGGTRFYPYRTDDEALTDVLRLAQGMTYKAAAAGLDLGGGKAVIIGDPDSIRTDELILSYGRFVDSLSGRYITAEDVGTTQADMDLIRTVTPHVTGTSGGSGDPSPATARGVVAGMRAVADHIWGGRSLAGRHVAISGVGKVGSALAADLAAEGARLSVADVDPLAVADATHRHGAAPVPPEKIHAIECDIFSPCALGGILNEHTIPELACAAVCGSANNQLATPADADRMAAAGVLYAPDYVVNAGGIINIFAERGTYDAEVAVQLIDRVELTTARVIKMAAAGAITTAAAADRLAEDRLAAATPDHRIRRFDARW